MKEWPHTLFSERDLSDYLVERWRHFTTERESADFDASLAKYILRPVDFDVTKITIAKRGECEPKPTDFPEHQDYVNARIAFLEGQLENRRPTFIIVDIPFEGDGNLLRYRPMGCTLPAPQGLLVEKSIKMRFERFGSKDMAWKTLFVNDLGAIDGILEAANVLVKGFNQRLREWRTQRTN